VGGFLQTEVYINPSPSSSSHFFSFLSCITNLYSIVLNIKKRETQNEKSTHGMKKRGTFEILPLFVSFSSSDFL
jgi:hypothetical protein